MATNLDDAPVTLPTEAELRAAYAALADAVEPILAVHWRVARIAEQIDEPDAVVAAMPPNLADIRALCVFKADVTARLNEIHGYVDDLDELATNQLASLAEADNA